MRTLILFFSLFLFTLNSFYAQDAPFAPDLELTVVAPSGMNLRAGPSTSEKVLGKLPRGCSCKTLDKPVKSHGEIFVDGIKGHWVRVKCDGNRQEGFIFSGYLANLKKPETPLTTDFRLVAPGDGEFSSYEYDPMLNYYAVVRKDSGFALKEVPIYFSGPKLDRLTYVSENGADLFIGTKKKLKPGPLSSPEQPGMGSMGFLHGSDLLPGMTVYLKYDYQNYTYDALQIVGKAEFENSPGFNELSGDPWWKPQLSNYKLLFTHIGSQDELMEMDDSRVQEISSFPGEFYWPFRMVFYGDLDGDGISDMITEESWEDENSLHTGNVLYLSSEAEEGKWLKKVARVEFFGGC